MPIVGTPRTFNKKWAFQILFDGFSWAGFSKCSELKVTIAQIKHSEGGSIIPHKGIGRAEFPDLSLERGATRGDRDMYIWMSSVVSAPANIGLKEVACKRNADLVQLDRDGEIMQRYSLFGCFPVEYTAGDWDNNADEIVIEKMTIAYDYFVQTQ
jgi:phage tail-like protein